jgi:protein-S-isoprenylcysteine O-methyltransferase Ste14
MKTFAMIVGVVNIVSFVWAVYFHFERSYSIRYQALSLLSIFCFLIYIVGVRNISSEQFMFWVVFVVHTSTLVVFWFSVSVTKKASLGLVHGEFSSTYFVNKGPYEYIRHPFYTVYVIYWIVCLCLVHNIALLIGVMAIVYLYVDAALQEESDLLTGEFASEYFSYRKCTGMFLPIIKT